LLKIRSKIGGETMLPMPMGIEQIFQETPASFKLKANIEEAVIKWARNISEVLAESSRIVFKQEDFPVPKDGHYFNLQRILLIVN
jgi:dynein heavy chain